MSEQTVTLKILGDNGHVIAVLAATKAAINDLGNTSKASGEKIDRGMDAGEKGLNEVGTAAAAAARKMEAVGTASDKPVAVFARERAACWWTSPHYGQH